MGLPTLKLSVLENLFIRFSVLFNSFFNLDSVNFDAVQVVLEFVIPLEADALLYLFSWISPFKTSNLQKPMQTFCTFQK